MKKVFIVAVLMILLFPTVWMFTVKTQPMVIEENRVREQRYAFKKAYTALFDNGEYCEQFSKWFNDHYGMRDVMIRTRNQIEYSLLGLTNGVYMGDEGYLVYKTTLESQHVYEQLDSAYFKLLFAKFEEVKELLEGKGIKFYIMIPPQKSTVFPERFDRVLPVDYPEETKYEYLVKELSQRFPENFIDVTGALVEAEQKAPVFFKTDFHWNSHGASAAFALLANKIAGQTIYTTDDYNIGSFDGFVGTQLNLFSLLETITETGYGSESITTSVITDKHLVRGSVNLTNTQEAKLGSLLIVGDSYSNYVVKYNGGVADCFSEINYVNTNDNPYDGLFNAITTEQADYVLIESIEIAMDSLLGKLEKLTK